MTYIYTYTALYIYIYTYMKYINMYTYIYIYIYAYIYVMYMYLSIYLYVILYIYIYIYIFIYENGKCSFCEYLNMTCYHAFVKVTLNTQLGRLRSLYAPSRHFWTPLLKKGSNKALRHIYCSFGYGFSNLYLRILSKWANIWALFQRISKIADLWALHWWSFQKCDRAISVTGRSNTA